MNLNKSFIAVVSMLLLGASLHAQTTKPTTQPASAPTSAPTTQKAKKPGSDFIKKVEKAHGAKGYNAADVIAYDIVVRFGGKERVNAKVMMKPDFSGIRMESGSDIVVWDGKTVWAAPGDSPMAENARFDIHTWPYFLALPFKLGDPGSHLAEKGQHEMNGKTYDVAKLTFGDGVGDAPDDWYVVYADAETGVIDHSGYIVTFGGRDPEQAAQRTSGISYKEYTKVDGFAVSTHWTFHKWTIEDGMDTESSKGSVKVSNIEVMDDPGNLFTKPDGAVEKKNPGA
jgi:hypothetical protein